MKSGKYKNYEKARGMCGFVRYANVIKIVTQEGYIMHVQKHLGIHMAEKLGLALSSARISYEKKRIGGARFPTKKDTPRIHHTR